MKRTVDSFDEIDADSNGDTDQVFQKYVRKPVNEVENITSKKYFAKRYAALLDTVSITIKSLDDEFADFCN